MQDISPDRIRQALIYGIGLLCALVLVGYLFGDRRGAAPQPFYYPDPTPYVVTNHTEVNILSGNQVCIGINTCN